MIPAIFNWSGGKDSSLALYRILWQRQYDIRYLLTSVNGTHNRISMHGVRRELLELQAKAIGIELVELLLPEMPSMEEYDALMSATMQRFKTESLVHSVFGDIFLEDLKKYRDEKLAENGFTGVYPLWKEDTRTLVEEFIDLGFKTVVVCCSADKLDASFCGRIIDRQFLDDLPADVDPAGENGEFHTFVFDGPLFPSPIPITLGEKVYRTYPNPVEGGREIGFWYQDLKQKPRTTHSLHGVSRL
ncbi:MAG: diphthine--ammonia ligase [Bacteroidota bacterium]